MAFVRHIYYLNDFLSIHMQQSATQIQAWTIEGSQHVFETIVFI